MKMIVAFASFALLAAPAFAQSGTVSGSGAELSTQSDSTEVTEGDVTQAANGERVICRRVQNDSSTRRTNARRICRTAQQWREAQRAR
jgi:hypothetical protein